jgi:hypothetical protein
MFAGREGFEPVIVPTENLVRLPQDACNNVAPRSSLNPLKHGLFASVGSKTVEYAKMLEPGFPVMRSSSTVRNRKNLNRSVNLSINNEDGKTGQLDLASAAWSKRPALWCIHNSVNGS